MEYELIRIESLSKTINRLGFSFNEEAENIAEQIDEMKSKLMKLKSKLMKKKNKEPKEPEEEEEEEDDEDDDEYKNEIIIKEIKIMELQVNEFLEDLENMWVTNPLFDNFCFLVEDFLTSLKKIRLLLL